jgi:hypothetical protein
LHIHIKNEEIKESEPNTVSDPLHEGIIKDLALLSISEEVGLGVASSDAHESVV